MCRAAMWQDTHITRRRLVRRLHWNIKRKSFVTNSTENTNESLLIDEFEIIELEDRLELAGRCNGRCDGQSKPTGA
jgi:hypothetical protein